MIFGSFLNIFIENIQSASFINSIKKVRDIHQPNSNVNQNQSLIQENYDEEKKDHNTSYHKLKGELEGSSQQNPPKNKPTSSAVTEKFGNIGNGISRSKKLTMKVLKQYSYLDVICMSICCCKPKAKQIKKNTTVIESQSSMSSFNQDKYKLYKEMDLIKYLNDIKEIKKALKKLLEPPAFGPKIYNGNQSVEVSHQFSHNLIDKSAEGEKINSSKHSYNLKEEEKEIHFEVKMNTSKNKDKELEAIKSINTIINQEIKQASFKNDTQNAGYEEINQEEVDKKDNNFGVSLRVHSNIFSLII
mmetsp:Transcript_7858/g.6953  ORF Transcript_7858/g.6953 Transcript_7858/m.6953 type:complete len:302 (+) Transcript_7858:144-1049(+)